MSEAQERRASRVRRLAGAFVAPLGDHRWNAVLRATGITALVGIPLVVLVPRSVPLVWLAVLSIPANSPLSPLIPAAFEPLIMEAAKYEHALWVTLVALAGYLYMEYLNWHLYSWVLSRRMLAAVRERAWLQRSLTAFGRAPFATVVFFAFTPLPFWVIRCLAILRHYPLRRFMGATAVGRFPRLFLYAWLGAVLRVPTLVLLGVIVGSGVAVIALRVTRGQPVWPAEPTAADVRSEK